jgi:hypothetical protein
MKNGFFGSRFFLDEAEKKRYTELVVFYISRKGIGPDEISDSVKGPQAILPPIV